MGPQDFTIEDLLADANATGATPEATATGLLRWRSDLLNYGRSSKGPEDYWKGATRLDQDLAPVLENLRTQEGVRILGGLPEEQRSFFMAQYTKANGRPENMAPEFQPIAQSLNDLPDKSDFSLPTKPSVLTLYTDDGKPLADAIVRGGEALVRPLKEGGNPFLVQVPQRSKDELSTLADEAEQNAIRSEDIKQAHSVNSGLGPVTDLAINKTIDDNLTLKARADRQRAEVYRSGDPVALAALDIGQTIKGDPNLLSQIADKDLADRFQAGLLRASIGTARALDDLKDLTFNMGMGEGVDQFKGFEEALQTTNTDTARSFLPTDTERATAAAAESAGQMAPTILPYGIATRAAGVAATELGAALTMAPASYGNELGPLLAQADELDSLGDKDQARRMRTVARWSSLLQAGIDTGTEMMFPEVAGALRGGKGIATRIATAPLKEGTEEVAAGVAERGIKQPLFYPPDQQQLLTEGVKTEFMAGAMAAAPINVASEAIGYRQRRDAEKAATAAAPDAGTARQVQEIFDVANEMAQLDLPEEGTAQGVGPETASSDVGVPPPAPQTEGDRVTPLTPPQESGAPLPATTLEVGPAPAVTPGMQDSGSDASILEPVVEAGTQAAPPPTITPPETTTTPPNEEIQRQGEGQGLQVAPETTDPAMESAPPGGVSDPGVATPGTGTGSSAPALSAAPVEAPIADTVSQVNTEVNTLPTVDLPHLQTLAGSNTIGESGLRLELAAYTPEERAFIARQIGAEDPSPAGLAKAMRYQQQGATRFSTGDPSIRGMTEAQARAALRSVPRNVTFINDAAARTPWGRPWAGRADRGTGQVTINLAFIKDAEDLRSRMNEEMLHLVWQDPAVRAAVATVEAVVTPAMRAEMARMGYDTGSQTEEAATRMVDRITRTPEGRSAWRRLLDAIRNAFRRLFRMEPDGRQVEAAARELMRYAMSERPAPQGQGTAYSENQDAEYMAAVERGDMETAQRMVDEAAKAAGYNVGPLWHGSWRGDFNTFKPSSHGKVGRGVYFTNAKKVAEFHAKGRDGDWGKNAIYRAYLKGRFLETGEKPRPGYLMREDVLLPQEVVDALNAKGITTSNGYPVSKYTSLKTVFNPGGWMSYRSQEISDIIEGFGYSGIILHDSDTAADTETVVFNPNQIKSADPVTRDDQGNVIPLSQRFNAQSNDIRYSAYNDFEQVFGIINGDVKPLRSKADARSIAKDTFFDGALPVTSANTDRAFELAREWADPASGPDVVQRLLDAGYAAGQENVDLIPGTAQGELFSYALKLVGTGDTSLLAFMDLTVNRWPVNGRNESLGTSEIAARLAARRDYSQSAMMDAVQNVNRQRRKKETTFIPQETMEAVTEAVTTTGLDETAVRQVKRNVKDVKGKTLEDKVEEKVADNVAQSLLERFAKSQSDTLSWGKGKDGNPIIDKIRALVRRSLTLGPNAVMWDRVWLINSLVDLGVAPELANALTATVAAERQRRANIQLLRQREREAEMEKRRVARETKQTAERARKMAEANERIAQDILSNLAELQADPQTNKPKPNPNAIRALVKQIMDPRVAMDGAVARPALEAELVKLGVSPATATTVTRAAWQQRENNIAVLDEQARQRAQDSAQALAEGEAGSLRGLEDAMLSAPVSATYSPVWRYNVAKEYFSQLGLTPRQAEAAARLYSIEFGARLADAQANAIERISETDAPWRKKLKSLSAPARKKALSDMDKLRRAVRAGVTDPDTIWYNVVAREHGWRGFTPEQNIRMGQIDELLSDPNTDEYKKKALMTELQDIVARAGVPPTIADHVVSSYTMSALSGLPTTFVQLSAPFSILRDFVSDLPSNPVVATRALIVSMESLVNEAVYAGKNDVYNHQVAEHLKESVPALRQLLETGLENLQSTNPATKAKGMVQIIVGSQQYIGRLLNSMDQGAIAASEIYKTTMFTNRQLRRLGWTRDQAGLVILAALDARNDLMAEAMQRGLPRSEAAVWANEQFKKRIYSSLAEVDPEMAEDITKGAANEAVGMVGRLSDGINNVDEGMIRTPINYVLDAINRMHTKGGTTALAARLMFGFVNVPFRAAMWYSGYSPYGLIRYAIHRYRVNRGKETFWKQSFGTRAQERQRLRDGVVGSFAMALGLLLRSNSGDDDPDKTEFKVIFTGKGPKDPASRQAWSKRFAPYSMNIKVGKAYFPFNMGRMGESVAWPFALSGALDDVALAKKGKLARNPGATFRDTPELFGSYFGSLTQRAAFQSIGRAFGTADSSQENAAATDKLFKQGAFTASAFIPWKGAMGSVTRLLSDPVETNTMSGVVLSNTPVVGALVGKPAINVLGDPLGDRSFAGRLYREGVPLVVRFPSTGSSSRAYDLIMEQGRGPSLPQRSALERMYGPIDPEQFYTYSKKRGELIKAEMEKRYDKLRVMDPEEFAAAMEGISRSVNPRAAKAANLSR